MPTDTLAILRRTSFLTGVAEEPLRLLAQHLTTESFPADSVVFAQGSRPGAFFILAEGRVDLWRISDGAKRAGHEVRLASLVPGDSFGEVEVLYRSPRQVSARARTAVRVLRCERSDLIEFLRTYPRALRRLKAQADTRRLALGLRLGWLGEDETVYALLRRHPIFLARSLVLPAVFLGVSAWAWFGPLGSATAGLAIAAVALLAGLGWGAWSILDWSNDYYLLTNRRVVWLEKIVGLYDSRRETPLAMVLSVDRSTDALGRWVGFGDVVVRNYTGQLVLRGVADPHAVAKLVEEHWQRLQEEQAHTDRAAMDAALQQVLQPGAAVETEPASATPGRLPAVVGMGHWTFQVRFEESGVITYRRHWAVLLGQLALPSALFLLVVGILGAQLGGMIDAMALGTSVPIAAALLLPVAGWWVYRYVDWANDLYQITPEQIVDVHRRPLGREIRKVAALENILGTEVDRKGVLGLMLNFGDVVTNIGSAQFTFHGVYDPNGVQQDIVRALEGFLTRKRQAQRRQRQNEMVEWLGSYHDQVAQRKDPPHPEPPPASGAQPAGAEPPSPYDV